ncbi:Gfo/Idh/MocA family oxidoreductase [Oligoflexus tunisiensis]|uniref:Gfo/Idh/MocA family oxidoreductase n=1 Tax=Oligoflexus tunisiensis TaxID=708132 RepID=UPI00114CCA15|nr:Gfo/Idh/MocA family oxidoreductase [Oligoflexus tunisiensis]
MKNIAVVGCGMLGSRHLQSLVDLSGSCKLFALDSYEPSLQRCRSILEDSPKHGVPVSYIHRVEDLPRQLDLVVVATNADIRAGVVRSLLDHAHVEFLILEKILFQSVHEYYDIGARIEKAGAKCFVNCPRRMYPFYQELFKNFASDPLQKVSVKGKGWGLACNGIHFIDLMAYLGRTSLKKIHGDQLHAGFIESKRTGFLEVNGSLGIEYESGMQLTIACEDSLQADLEIDIQATHSHWSIVESQGLCKVKRQGQEQEELVRFQTLYQSQLSKKFAEDLLTRDTCELTSYAESTSLHLSFIEALMQHFTQFSTEALDRCPIT